MSIPVAEPVLPFLELSWVSFEDFCEELIAQLPGIIPESVKRMGLEGNDQQGIDIFATTVDGKHHAYQCRRHKSFGPQKLRNAVEEVEYKADLIVVIVGCRVGAKVRTTCKEYPTSDIWDARDLSRRVLEIPNPNTQRQLVRRFFAPAWLRDFLRQPVESAFITGDEFFCGLLDTDVPFKHSLPLVGRSKIINELSTFICEGDPSIGILSGAGGVGKSKILYELWQRHKTKVHASKLSSVSLIFLSQYQSLKHGNIDALPQNSRVIVIDDAHRSSNDDLRALIGLVQQRLPSTKLLLATRPWAEDDLLRRVRDAGIDQSRVRLFPKLGPLSSSERIELAQYALGSKTEFTKYLSEATADCALLTVVGGYFIQTDPDLANNLRLRSHQDFRHHVMNRYVEEMKASLPHLLDPTRQLSLLEVIAVLSPFPADNWSLCNEVARWIGLKDVDELYGTLERLVRAGIASRKGYKFRLIPDVFSDHILRRACVGEQINEVQTLRFSRASTTFPVEVYKSLPSGGAQVLRNIAELDWMDEDRRASNEVWRQLETEFLSASHGERVSILRNIEDAAYFAPEKAMLFVRRAIASQATDHESDDSMLWLGRFSYQDVLRRLPPILKRVAFNLNYLQDASDLLWELGRDQPGTLNAEIGHPVRILQDLAEYHPQKPREVTEQIVEACTRWLKEPTAHRHLHSPLDVAEKALQRQISVTRTVNRKSLVIQDHIVSSSSVSSLVTKVLDLFLQAGLGEDLAGVGRSIKGLEKALRPYDCISGEEQEAEQLAVLDCLMQIVSQQSHPLVNFLVKRSVSWTAKNGWTDLVRLAAQQILDVIPHDFEYRWQVAFRGGDEATFEILLHDQREVWESKQYQFIDAATKEFLNKIPDDDQKIERIDQTLSELAILKQHAVPAYFIEALARYQPQFIHKVITKALASQTRPIATLLENLVRTFVNSTPSEALRYTSLMCASESREMRVQAASLLGLFEWHDPRPEQVDSLQRLLCDNETIVAETAGFSLWRIAGKEPQQAIALLLSTSAWSNCKVADEMLGVIVHRNLELTKSQRIMLLQKMMHLQKLHGHWLHRFITDCASIIPEELIDFLIARLQNPDVTDGETYDPFPRDWEDFDLSGVHSSPHFERLLRKTRDLVLTDGPRYYFFGKTLFAALATGRRSTAVEVLKEWVEDGTPQKVIGAARLLAEFSTGPVFRNLRVVDKILDTAARLDTDTFKSVESALSGVNLRIEAYNWTPGETPPYLVRRARWSRRLGRIFPPGSEAHRFYGIIADQTDAKIRHRAVKDEEDDCDDN